MDKFKVKFNKIKQLITQNVVEIFMFIGLFFILYATFVINFIAFLYVLGTGFIILSVFLLKFPSRR